MADALGGLDVAQVVAEHYQAIYRSPIALRVRPRGRGP